MHGNRRRHSFQTASWLLYTWLTLLYLTSATLAAESNPQQQLAFQFGNLVQASRYAEAEAIARQGLALSQQIGRADWVSDWLGKLGGLYSKQSLHAKAEKAYQQLLALEERVQGPQSFEVAVCLRRLGEVHEAQHCPKEAAAAYKRSLEIAEKLAGPDNPNVAMAMEDLALVYAELKRDAEAEALLKRSLAIRIKVLGTDHLHTGAGSINLAWFYSRRERPAEAEPLFRRAVAIYAKHTGPGSTQTEQALRGLAGIYEQQLRYADAEACHRQALEMSKTAHGRMHNRTCVCLNNLASVCALQGRYAEAEGLYREALEISETVNGPEHVDTAANLNNLAGLYINLGRYAEVETLYRRALGIFRKAMGPEHGITAIALNNLAHLYGALGRYAEAEMLHKQALAILEKQAGSDNPFTAICLHNLAGIYEEQRRAAEAQPLFRRSLDIRLKSLGRENPLTIDSLETLAGASAELGRAEDAEKLYQEAIALRRKVQGEHHPAIAHSHNLLGLFYVRQRRFAEAEKLFQQSLAAEEKALGPEHPDVGTGLLNLAWLDATQVRFSEALPLAERAVKIFSPSGTRPSTRHKSYFLRAQILWHLNRREEAIADLRQALELAEEQRGLAGGGEYERSEVFGQFAGAYETMLAWQTEVGDVEQALSAIERSRARSLLDEMLVSGVDLNIGRPPAEREELRKREAELKTRIASLQRQLSLTANLADGGRQRLEAELPAANEALYQYYRDQRSSSFVSRRLLAAESGPLPLKEVQQDLTDSKCLLLEYFFGELGGYVLVVAPDMARLVPLMVDEGMAQILEVKPGPLDEQKLKDILVNHRKTGVMQLISRQRTAEVDEKLAALWKLLVPHVVGKQITGGDSKYLIVVPDGPLAYLPLEALLVDPGRYLLDVGPPILYAPSITILHNLLKRVAPKPADGEPVLTLGNPQYTATGVANAAGAGPTGPTITQSRYAWLGGKLTPLPFTAWECKWVAEAFHDNGIGVIKLEGPQATEAALRKALLGRRIVHLACHGLTDHEHGNFYGALALTPGAGADLDDDGFLTLGEIYALPLTGCDLAILSACRTNYGPQQKGEGVWTLSRGFLVAGSRRVVASNWLVDDAAAAATISYFCTLLAQAEKKGSTLDYALALQKAKRWAKQRSEWKSPYYWAPFVLVGPK